MKRSFLKPTPTRAAALARLDAFTPLAGRDYRTKRNFDYGPGEHSNVSGLSPYIRHRVISETEVLQTVLAQHRPAVADKFVQEVFWRTYWKGWLEHRPAVWLNYLQQVASAKAAAAQNAQSGDAYQQAIEGKTGIAPMDAWVNELVTTGYLHNHARMWFASIWIFTLKLPWVLGADFFLRHLLDGDPASNTLSWRWVAGLHTKGKTYLASADNMEKYAGERFFSNGVPAGLDTLTDQADPIEEAPLLPARAPELPGPITVGAAAGLLLTEDDLHLELPGEPLAVAAWIPEANASSPASELVHSFKNGLGQDALNRAQQVWPKATVANVLGNVAEIISWVQREELTQVYAAYIPQGHPGMQRAKLKEALAQSGCDLRFIARDYDRCVWPHADRGFFKLKKKIPTILASLDLADPAH